MNDVICLGVTQVPGTKQTRTSGANLFRTFVGLKHASLRTISCSFKSRLKVNLGPVTSIYSPTITI